VAADEHRRRGWRDRVQARAQVGLRPQGHRALQGQDRVRGGQLLGPDPERRLLEHRPDELRGLRALHAGLRDHTLRRPRGPRQGRPGPQRLRLHGRADPGRSRRRRTQGLSPSPYPEPGPAIAPPTSINELRIRLFMNLYPNEGVSTRL
jgi:hypothetical protein